MKRPDFLRHTDFSLLSSLSSFLSFFSSVFFSFREREERERERERGHSFVSARERANALRRTEREREICFYYENVLLGTKKWEQNKRLF